MALNSLIGVLESIGAPFLKKIITETAPPPFDKIGGAAIDVLADALGTAPDPQAIADRYLQAPKETSATILQYEADPGLILAGVQQQQATNELLLAEQKEPWWGWAWRPAGMWGLGVLWFWNIILLHVLNAIFKIALPPTDPWVLFNLSALYMGLYMGGHTVKDFVAKKWGVN